MTANADRMISKADVTVIGAGIGGISAALCLRRTGLSVALVERREDIFLGASLIPGRLHYGGMYFKEFLRDASAPSAKECVAAAIAFNRMFRGDIWSEDAGTAFILGNDAEPSASQAALVSFHELLAAEYGRIARSYKGVATEVPFRPLSPTEHALYAEIRGGVRTVEPGVSTAKLAVGLRQLLKDEGVQLSLRQEAKTIERLSDGRGFRVRCHLSDGQEVSTETLAVVQCAGVFGPHLDSQIGLRTSCRLTLKGAAIFPLNAESIQVPTTFLVAGGSFNFHRRGPTTLPSNGMIVSAGANAKEIDSLQLPNENDWTIPDRWTSWLNDRVTQPDWLDRACSSLEIGARFIPSLGSAEPVQFLVRATVSHNTELDSRSHVNVYAEDRGYFATTCVKLSSAPQLAVDVAQRVSRFLSGRSGVSIYGERPKSSIVPDEFTFALRTDRNEAVRFAASHGLTEHLVPSELGPDRWPPWNVLEET